MVDLEKLAAEVEKLVSCWGSITKDGLFYALAEIKLELERTKRLQAEILEKLEVLDEMGDANFERLKRIENSAKGRRVSQ